MALVSQMRGTPPTHVVRMRTAPTVGPNTPLLSRPRVTAGLAVGLRREMRQRLNISKALKNYTVVFRAGYPK